MAATSDARARSSVTRSRSRAAVAARSASARRPRSTRSSARSASRASRARASCALPRRSRRRPRSARRRPPARGRRARPCRRRRSRCGARPATRRPPRPRGGPRRRVARDPGSTPRRPGDRAGSAARPGAPPRRRWRRVRRRADGTARGRRIPGRRRLQRGQAGADAFAARSRDDRPGLVARRPRGRSPRARDRRCARPPRPVAARPMRSTRPPGRHRGPPAPRRPPPPRRRGRAGPRRPRASSVSASRARRSPSARASSGESPRPIRTENGSRTAPPSRVTASQPSGSNGCSRTRRVEVGCPHRTLEQRPRRAGLVAPDRVPETAAAGRGQRVLEPADVGRRAAARCPVRGVDPFTDRELAALAAEAAHGRLLHDVGPRELAQRGLDRRPEPGIHAQVVVHAPSADAPGRPGDAARLLVGQSPLERREPAGRRGQRAAGGRRPLARGTAAPVGGVRGQAGGLPRLDRRALLRLCGGERARGLRERGLELRDPRRRRRRPPLLVAGSAGRLVDPPARRLGLAGPCRLRAAHGRQLVATGAARGAERAKLREALGERPVGVGERGLQREIRLRDGLREPAPVGLEIGLRGGTLAGDPRPVARGGLELADRTPLAQAERGVLGASGLVDGAPLGLELGAGRHRRRDRGDLGLGAFERLERQAALGAQRVAAALGVGGPGRRLVPAGMGRDDQRGGQLLARGEPRRLLLGELAEAARLRPELGQDVLDPGQVPLGLGQLLLGLAAPPLVAPDPGDLLEQGPPLLGAERQRLVDHALADEQERVLREVRAVQQVDEVAQPDALAVEEVVVLARAVEAPAELDHAVLDRQQGVAVVEHERHVGHALGRPLLGARPDHVLGAPDPERSPLLAQRPAERVGEVGLARSVGPDDGADARAELDSVRSANDLNPWTRSPSSRAGAVTSRLPSPRPTPRRRRRSSAPARRPIAAGSPSAGRRRRLRGARRRPSWRSTSSAWAAADVSAMRRDGPSPTPSVRPFTSTSIRNCFSWSGPTASTRR